MMVISDTTFVVKERGNICLRSVLFYRLIRHIVFNEDIFGRFFVMEVILYTAHLKNTFHRISCLLIK